MKILFCLPAETVYEQQGRVMGWRATPAPREKLKQLKALVPRFIELGVERVICSDLDNQSGWAVAKAMGLRCEEWHSARRLNWGKFHGLQQQKASEKLKEQESRWEKDPNIPIAANGDSRTSYKNRMSSLKDKLSKANGVKAALVLLGANEVSYLTGAKINFERNHVYEWSL